MKLKWLFSTTAMAILIAVVIFGFAGHDSVVAAQDASSKIETILLDKFVAEGDVDFIVRFTEQADLSSAESMDWDTRGEFVYNTLRDTAANSQVNAKAILDQAGLRYETFIAGNDLYVWAGSQLTANSLAALPEVYFIRAARTYQIDPISEVTPLTNINWSGDLLASKALTTVGSSPDALAWGISYTHADQFWSAYGVQGNGIKVANIDTGVQWNHPALDQSFACPGDPTNAACWRDPSNVCGAGGACDNNGHGTHTMGTMVGDDDAALTWQAGMAPSSTWIACKGCETNSCSNAALLACADWILAPGGSTANRPNVVNNSWGGGGGDPWYQADVQAWVAAGIFPAFSAGNAGSGCNTLGSPGDYQESFASAAVDSGGNIASFSSRGPSAFGHNPYTKPNIAAPGVSVCSSVPTNAWSCGYSGTSMASPHTAGAVALLWSCNPAMVGQIDATFQALQNSAGTPPAGSCGAPGDGGNYTYGYGYLDVLAAGVSVCGGFDTGTLEGHVYDDGGEPVAGASVSASPATEGNSINAITDPNGFYTMDIAVGTYNVTASKTGYQSQTINGVVVTAGGTTVQNFEILYLGAWTPGPTMCFDLTRLDAEYYAPTGLVYILGGRGGATGGDTIPNIYSFNPATGQCLDTGVDMPDPISNYTINLVNDGTNDLLCTFGGRAASGSSTLSVQCYNPIANTVSIVTTLPAAYTGFTPGGQAVVDNMVYVFGGFNNVAAPYELARTDRYNPVTHSFTQIGNLSLARAYLDVAVVDGKIFAFGGTVFDGANLNAQTRTEVMADPGGAGTWDNAAVAELSNATAEGRAFGFDSASPYNLAGKIIIAGGGQWPGESADVISYDVASNTYDPAFPDLVTSRRDHAGVFVPDAVGGAMWVFGGRTGGVDTPPYAGPEYYLVSGPAAPDIVVTPASLEATLLPNTTRDVTLTITNNGDGALDWNLVETPALKLNGWKPEAATPPAGGWVQMPAADLASAGDVSLIQPEASAPGAAFQMPEVVLYDNGPLVTHPGGGAGGLDASALQTALGLSTYGFGHAVSSGYRMADDFVITDPDGWQVDQITFFAYQTGSGTTCSMNSLNYQIWDGPPDDPLSSVVFGDTTTNRLVSCSFSNIYRVLDTGLLDTARPIMADVASAGISLPAGTYWLDWQTGGTLASGPWAPPISVLGQTTTGNALQWDPNLSVWNDAADLALLTPQGLPFIIEGTILPPYDVPWLSENPTSGTVAGGDSVDVTVTFNSAGKAIGEYLASLKVNSNDADTPTVTVPVTMIVESVDLEITKSDSPDPVKVGENLTYTLGVTNSGLQDATGVVVVDTLPAGVTFVSASAGCAQAAGVVTCTVGNLAMGNSVPLTIVVKPTVAGSIVNQAEVTGTELDPDLTNNAVEVTTTVEQGLFYSYLSIVAK